VSRRRLQEVLLAVGDDGNGYGIAIQRRRANKAVSQSSDQCQTGGGSSTTVDISFSHCLQHESDQKVSVAGRSEHRSEEQKKASDRYAEYHNMYNSFLCEHFSPYKSPLPTLPAHYVYNGTIDVPPFVCLSVRPSVRPLFVLVLAHSSKPAAAGLLLGARQAGDIRRLLHGRRSAAASCGW